MIGKRNAFTLIELLIVVAIIGVLAAIAVPNFLNAQVRAKVAKTEAEMKTYVTACEMYRLDNGKYFPHPQGHFPWQNKYLTTPTAYCASVPRDLFQDVVRPDESAWNLAFGEYHMETIYNPDGTFFWEGAMDPRKRVPNNPEDLQRALSGKPYAYELWSIGPNEKLDYYVSGSGIDGFIYYRPSNGIKSTGDIVWIRP
ncbi:MAG TPA: type II secretion system protein [bacterium]|nr:type II secretion system protein [bacterium]